MLTQDDARDALARTGIPAGQDFFTLTVAQVESVLAEADRFKYRKPKAANGSRGRYFYALLVRRAAGPRWAIEFRLWTNYGHGWEHEVTEETRREVRERQKEYAANAPTCRTRITRARVRVTD